MAGRSPNGRSVSGKPSAVSDPEIPEVMSALPRLLRKTLATVLFPATRGTVLSWSCAT